MASTSAPGSCEGQIAELPRRCTVNGMEDRTTAVVKEILGRLGIEAVESYDTVSAAVDAELSRRGFSAKVAGIRWGCVTVAADRHEFAQVNWMKDVLENIARRSSRGTITSVRIRGIDSVGARTEPARDDERNRP